MLPWLRTAMETSSSRNQAATREAKLSSQVFTGKLLPDLEEVADRWLIWRRQFQKVLLLLVVEAVTKEDEEVPLLAITNNDITEILVANSGPLTTMESSKVAAAPDTKKKHQ